MFPTQIENIFETPSSKGLYLNNVISSSSNNSSSTESSTDSSSSSDNEEHSNMKHSLSSNDINASFQKIFKSEIKATEISLKFKASEKINKTIKCARVHLNTITSIEDLSAKNLSKSLFEEASKILSPKESATKISIEQLLKIEDSVDEVVKKISIDLKNKMDAGFEVIEHGTINNESPLISNESCVSSSNALSFSTTVKVAPLPADLTLKSSATTAFDTSPVKRRGPKPHALKKTSTKSSTMKKGLLIFDDFDSDSMDIEAELLRKMHEEEEEAAAVLNLTDFGLRPSEQVNHYTL